MSKTAPATLNFVSRCLDLDEEPMTVRQLAILVLVATYPNEEHSVRTIANAFGLLKPTVSRALDKLEEAGMVYRDDDENKRSPQLKISPLGIAAMNYLCGTGTLPQLVEEREKWQVRRADLQAQQRAAPPRVANRPA